MPTMSHTTTLLGILGMLLLLGRPALARELLPLQPGPVGDDQDVQDREGPDRQDQDQVEPGQDKPEQDKPEQDKPEQDKPEEKKTPDGLFPGIEVDLVERRLILEGAIAVPRGLIELLACTAWGKTHESICSLTVQPQHLKAALLLLGLKEKPQVKTFGQRMALKGDRVVIYLEWERDGKKERHRAEKLIWDRSVGGPMEEVGWVFTGSRFLKVPVYVKDKEEPEEREVFMASETGSLVTTYHDPDSILDNPLEKGGDDTIYHANDRLLPPRGTPIRFIIEVAAEEKDEPEPKDE